MIELRPHQRKAVEDLSDGKILVGGVGTGKTLTALAYFYEKILGGVIGDWSSIKHPTDLYVFTTARKRESLDWQVDASKFGIFEYPDDGIPGVNLVVDSYNNIAKYEEIKDAFIILDEQRMVGSGSWTKTFIKMAKVNRWIMLSATPGDKWEDYIPVFIANGFYRNRTEFKRRHCVYSYFGPYPKLERYLEVGRLTRLRDSILIDMPYERHTTRHIHEVTVDHDKELFERVYKKRWNVYENRPLKDVSELFSVMRKVVNSDSSRLTTLVDLIATHPKVIVFYNFDYELEILRTLSGPVIAEWNGHKHEKLPVGDSWVYLVQYVAGAEAWNCTTTDTVIFYSLTYSYKNFEQAQGRIDRLDTPFCNLHYYVFVSDSIIDRSILKNLRNKEDFNERKILL